MLPKHLVIPNIFTNFASMKLNSMMKHHTYTPKSLKVSGLRLIGGGKTLNISVLHNSLISFLYDEKCVPLQCRNKDRNGRLGQPEFCFRPARFYCLPSAQKFRLEIGKRELINH